jgi:hypothetical protein
MPDQGSTSQLSTAKRAGGDFVDSTAFEWFSRAGFLARGAVYAVIGILALKVAVGHGGKLESQKGALHTVANQPFGKVLLGLVAVGLGGYALWRFARAALGRGPEGSDKGLERVAALGSGLVYAGLCVLAVQILLGAGSSSGSSPKKSTAGVPGWPGGAWLVGIAGIVLIGIGLYQAYRGISQKFFDDSKVEEMSPPVKKWVGWAGTAGHVARGVVFALSGIFLIKAAVEYDPNKAVGLDGALAKLVQHSYGPYLLGMVAAGLVAFALFTFADARYRKI